LYYQKRIVSNVVSVKLKMTKIVIKKNLAMLVCYENRSFQFPFPPKVDVQCWSISELIQEIANITTKWVKL